MTILKNEHKLGSDVSLRRYASALEMVANPADPTPLLRLNRVAESADVDLFLKLEWMSPFGSIKDRTAAYLLRGMLERGELDGKEIVEPTSGNTGIALAAIAAILGAKIKLTIPDGVPAEKKIILRMLGAEVWETPDDLCPIDHPKDGAIALAHSFIESEGGRDLYAMPNQYANPDNVRAHYETTGPEIWAQTEGRVKYFIAGYGTCGTITGVGRFLKKMNPDVIVVAVEPQKGHRLPGLKNLRESKQPEILDSGVIDRIVSVDDGPAYEMTKRIFREEGLIVGPSTGAIARAALDIADSEGGVAVAVSPDSGFKYASYFADIIGNEGIPKE